MTIRTSLYTALAACVMLAACAGTTTAPSQKSAQPVFEPVPYRTLPGWNTDRQNETLAALRQSCTRILKADPERQFGPAAWSGTFEPWQAACRVVPGDKVTVEEARRFFETYFTPVRVHDSAAGEQGLFTGYYEASLKGSKTRKGAYQTALLERPSDLVTVDLGAFREEWKGKKIAGRVQSGALQPYPDRAAIETGAIPATQAKAIAYVNDPVDAFFLHVQGSGRVAMDDGSELRVGYAAQNGRDYYAIGKELVKRGALKQDEVSMQTIRDWLAAHPKEAREVMNLNPSYVFFQPLKTSAPLGGEGVPLTPRRSLAVDRTLYPYGMPVWIDTAPVVDGKPRLARLMMAQDTGGAIRGPVRGDFFWGYGDQADYYAGHMKSKGAMWLLLPRSVASGLCKADGVRTKGC